MKKITLKQYLGILDSSSDDEVESSGLNAREIAVDQQKKWWDIFYRRNESRFFKDRHWTFDEFPELTQTDQGLVILEAGCGVGNFVIPLMEMNPKLKTLYACDISDNAVALLKKHPNYEPERCISFQCDLVQSPEIVLHANISPNSVDIATLVFVLSAIPPKEDNMARVLSNLATILKPGGLILFRDYADGDYAQIRFEDSGDKKKPLSGCDKCFVRRDNTLSYFFTTEECDALFRKCGFDRVQSEYIYRETTNRKEGVTFKRKFIQGRYLKK